MRKYTLELNNMFYSPPDLLLGEKGYGNEIDIWAIGCIIAEMTTGKVLFESNCKYSQLIKIFKLLGTPTIFDWPTINDYCHFNHNFPNFVDSKELDNLCERIGKDGIDLLHRMLCCNPNKRISGKVALKHPFVSYLQ